jgi:uncharacterized hydrophobic protein (TIGR00271 family)
MAVTLFSSLTEEDKSGAVERLVDQSTPRDSFFFMTILSVLMATFGLIINNSSVIIGSMLVAPLLSPVLSLALSVIISDFRLLYRSFWTLTKAVIFSVPVSALATLFLLQELGPAYNPEILSRTEPSIVFAAIGLVAGMAASFAMIKPGLNAALPGVAISVALIPPLGVTGIGLARLDWNLISNSLILFVINIAAIMFASMIIFSLMNLYIKRGVAKRAVRKTDKELEEAEKKAEELSEEMKGKKKSTLESVEETIGKVRDKITGNNKDE